MLQRLSSRHREAELLCKRALAIKEEALGPNHPDVAVSLNNLAGLYHTLGRYKEAEPRYKRALAVMEATLSGHPYINETLMSYAALLRATNRPNEAEKLEARAEALEAYKRHITCFTLA